MFSRFILRRLILAIPMLLGITLVLFLIYNLVQVDPLVMIVGERAMDKPDIVAAATARWGLDRPVWEQYLRYVANMLQGDFGDSFQTKRAVLTDIIQFLPATIELAMSSFLFATRLIFLTIFYFNLGIAPGPGRLDPRMTSPERITGLYTVDTILQGNFPAFINALHHLVLPTLILGGFTLALVIRVTRASIIDEMRRDYIRTARGKGMTERRVIVQHALRNVLIPLVTILGLAFAGLLSGAVMTETVFDWPGLGQYLVKAAVALDYPAIQGGTILIAILYIIVNMTVDILYGVLDPRVRYD
jgi:peptide/nickel transport system permease protein